MSIRKQRFVCIVTLIVCSLCAAAQESERAALLTKRTGAPISAGKRRLTDALVAAGFAMRSHFLIYGVELADKDCPVQPTVFVDGSSGTTLGTYLEAVFHQLPGYEYEVVSGHLIAVYPKGAKDDPDDALNLKIAKFVAVADDAGRMMAFPAIAIPELRAKLFPPEPGKPQIFTYAGIAPAGPKVTLHLRDVTVRELLNAVAVATETPAGDGRDDAPYGWIYRTCDGSGRRQPSWGVLSSRPPNWRQLVHFTGKPQR